VHGASWGDDARERPGARSSGAATPSYAPPKAEPSARPDAPSLLALQRRAGNRAVARMVQASDPVVQREGPGTATAAPAGSQDTCQAGAAAVSARAVQWLTDAAGQLDVLGRPAGPTSDPDRARVATAVRGLFATEDPAYVQVLVQRLRHLASSLSSGRVSVQCGGTGCTIDQSGSGFVAAYVERPYEVHLCQRSPSASNEGLVETFIHEAAHAALPDIGVRREVNGSNVSDRAYTHERMFARLRTEEALDNAESYGVLVRALATRSTPPPSTAPTDAVTGCSEPERVHDALAHVQVWARFAEATARGLARYLAEPGHAIDDPGDPVRALARTHLPSVQSPADLTLVTTRLFGLVRALRSNQAVACQAGTGPVLGASGRLQVTASGLTSGRRGAGGLTLTEAWVQADEQVRRRTLFALLLATSDSGVPPADAWAYAAFAREVAQHHVPSTAGRAAGQHEFAEERFRMVEARTSFLRSITDATRVDHGRARAILRLSDAAARQRQAVQHLDVVGQARLQTRVERVRRLWAAGTYGLDASEPVVTENRDAYRRALNEIRQLAGTASLLANRAGGAVRAREDRLLRDTWRRVDEAARLAAG
jgi:hypothetical protein